MTDQISSVADIEGVRVDYDGDGEIDTKTDTPIQVKVNHYLYEEFVFDPDEIMHEDELEELAESYEPGEVIDDEFRGGAYARLKYEFEDGTAVVKSFKDASSEADGAGWTALDFLKVLPVADEVVERIPEVDEVRPSPVVLGGLMDDGEQIKISQT